MKVDTLRLHNPEFKVLDLSLFGRYENEPNDSLLRISTYYYNTDLINVEFKEVWNKETGVVEKRSPLHINISVPKLLSGKDNVDYEIKRGIDVILADSIKDLLSGLVEVDYSGFCCDRIDVYKNVPYKPLDLIYWVDTLRFNMKYKKNTYDTEKTHNITFHNKSREYALYDKVKELEDKGVSVSIDGDITRGELRLKRKKVIADVFGGEVKFFDILDIIAHSPDVLKDVYNKGVLYILNGLKDVVDGFDGLRGVDSIERLKVYPYVVFFKDSENVKSYNLALSRLYKKGIISRASYYRHKEWVENVVNEVKSVDIERLKRLLLYD